MFRRKLIGLLLSAVVVLGVVPLKANAANVMVGDVNADNSISIGDVARLYAHFQGNSLVGQASMTRADLNDAGWLYPAYVQDLYEQTRHFTLPNLIAAVSCLPENTVLSDIVTLGGRVVAVHDYNSEFNNMTLTIKVDDSEETIRCYRMVAGNFGSGDYIVVTGQLRHYEGQVEFAPGCTGENNMVWMYPVLEYKNTSFRAYHLPVNVSAREEKQLVGKVIAIEPVGADATEITVTIHAPGCSDKPIVCRNMVGDDIHRVRLGDALHVTGILQNSNGTVEFAPGCVLEWIDTIIQYRW